MHIIILKDKKGFTKTVEVPGFPPTYSIADISFAKVNHKEYGKTLSEPIVGKITFYPKHPPSEYYGRMICEYREGPDNSC